MTLTCGVPHPTAGWRFYWYRVDRINLNPVPRCEEMSQGRSDPREHIADQFRYELLPGSDGGTEQNSSVIQGQMKTAEYVCRAGRGDPVFYTEYSDPKWVWSGGEFGSFS